MHPPGAWCPPLGNFVAEFCAEQQAGEELRVRYRHLKPGITQVEGDESVAPVAGTVRDGFALACCPFSEILAAGRGFQVKRPQGTHERDHIVVYFDLYPVRSGKALRWVDLRSSVTSHIGASSFID
ncbi:MAG TPA: hypothetical protein VGG16_04905 [Streptosporangiaceae bacterium]|jgi:hypothetical protein